jgi:Domain of unknown function (DUF6265)
MMGTFSSRSQRATVHSQQKQRGRKHNDYRADCARVYVSIEREQESQMPFFAIPTLVLALLVLGRGRQSHEATPGARLPEWLAGCWKATTTSDTLDEFWTAPRGGMMLGVSRLVHNSALITYEQNRITIRGSRVVFLSQVDSGAVKEFSAVDLSPNEATFDGRGAVTERVRYRRDADTLRVRFARRAGRTERGVEEPLAYVVCEHR